MSSPRELTHEDLLLARGWSEAPPSRGSLSPLSPTESGLAMDDGEGLVVLLRGRRTLDEAELDLLWTRPDARCAGWAGRLLASWMRGLATEGVRRVLLEVRADNRPAGCLYERMGFRELSRRRGYYGDVDARVMVIDSLCAAGSALFDEPAGRRVDGCGER